MAAYSLTLTAPERRAIDFVGDRYSHGYELYDILMDDDCERFNFDKEDEHGEWDDDEDIQFNMEEYLAWDLKDICQEDNYALPLFNETLKAKLIDFCAKII